MLWHVLVWFGMFRQVPKRTRTYQSNEFAETSQNVSERIRTYQSVSETISAGIFWWVLISSVILGFERTVLERAVSVRHWEVMASLRVGGKSRMHWGSKLCSGLCCPGPLCIESSSRIMLLEAWRAQRHLGEFPSGGPGLRGGSLLGSLLHMVVKWRRAPFFW